MLADASEKISGIVNNMPIPDSTQIAVIAMGRLEGEAGSDSGCSVITFFCLTAGWGIAMATWEPCTQNRSVLRVHRRRRPARADHLSGDTSDRQPVSFRPEAIGLTEGFPDSHKHIFMLLCK
jgi:hypothetical protein